MKQAYGVWNALLVASIIALIGALGFHFYQPPQAMQATSPPPLKSAIDRTDTVTENSQKRIQEKVWNVESQQLEGAVLTQLSTAADKYHIQLADFRLEKTVVVSGQAEAPVMVVLEGNFGDMMKLLASVEGPDSKLGVGLLQLTASDQGQGFVKATFGLTAFLRKVA